MIADHELLGDRGVFSVVQALVRPVIEHLLGVLYDEPGRPHHHGRSENYLSVEKTVLPSFIGAMDAAVATEPSKRLLVSLITESCPPLLIGSD